MYFQAQYEFIYDTVAMYLQCGITVITAKELPAVVQKLAIKDQQTKLNGFEREYKVLLHILSRPTLCGYPVLIVSWVVGSASEVSLVLFSSMRRLLLYYGRSTYLSPPLMSSRHRNWEPLERWHATIYYEMYSLGIKVWSCCNNADSRPPLIEYLMTCKQSLSAL